ncbi:MAG TPA: PAC2 family protein [Acidimicrobiales bacterium]|nr:PAC2 family protein [Acidimicrobiales bacterium]
MPLYEVVAEPALSEPALVVALEGWIDAGLAAAGAMAHLRASLDTSLVATFDTEELLDHRSRRPVMRLVEGVNTGLTWPTIELRHGHDLDGRDVLLLAGPEPDMRWRTFVADALDLIGALGVRIVLPLGAYPAPIPHTRPGRIATTATTAELARRVGTVQGNLDVPAGVQGALEEACGARGLPAVGLWAQIPHYVSAMAYPGASAELIDAVAVAAGLRLDAAGLREAGRALRVRLDELVAGNEEHVQMVTQLEAHYDAETSERPSSILPSGEQLATEIERWLRNRD